jgi:predicted ATPase
VTDDPAVDRRRIAGRATIAFLDPTMESQQNVIPLRAFLDGPALPVSEFLPLAVATARALAAVHRSGTFHGELRPDVVWIAEQRPVRQVNRATAVPPAPVCYLSPEQTGRTGHPVDERSDLYALGIIYYEMLVGHPPFEAADALDVVHAHLAQAPTAVTELVADLPPALAEIVAILLSKSPDDRYQSALGVESDLAACHAAWIASGRIERRVTGRLSSPARLRIRDQFYGRQRETRALRAAFDRVSAGGVECFLVSGYAGIGKTTLVRDALRDDRRGRVVSGKFDQIARVPYSAFVHAMDMLIRQLLTEGDEQLRSWRDRITNTLGAGSAVLAELIPSIEAIIGPQPQPPPVSPVEAQNRFRLVVQKFMGAVSTPGQPLVLFLDDLHWADSASLDLLEPLLAAPGLNLLLVGAYRDTEVDAAHPVVRVVRALEAAGIPVHSLTLGPLGLEELTHLIRDALGAETSETESLARLIQQKTDGNPFFVIHFLEALQTAGLLLFDEAGRGWTFDLRLIAAAGMTDNVIDLMTRKIHRLTGKAQSALTLAACIGNRFDLDTLATVSRETTVAVQAHLAEAVDEGLVLRSEAEPAFAFLHDRVQQAAYARIPAERRQFVHATVGRLLREQMTSPATDERLFDVVNHLNLGRSLIEDPAERRNLADLNLAAGRRAKTSTAYHAALAYLQSGIDALEEKNWATHYELCFALHLGVSECEYLTGDFTTAEQSFARLHRRARTDLDRALIFELEILQNESMSRYEEAIRVGRRALRMFDLDLPEDPERVREALDEAMVAIDRHLAERTIASLLDLPAMIIPEQRALIRLLAGLHTSCYLSADKDLTLLNTAAMVRLSLEHGNAVESAYGYALHAMHVGPIRGDHRTAYEFGTLALKLAERSGSSAVHARVLMNLGWNVYIWRQPLRESIALTQEAFRRGNDSGLFVEAAYASFNECWLSLLAGRDLAACEDICAANVEYVRHIRMARFATGGPQVILQWVRALRGATERPVSLTGIGFDEAAFRADYRGDGLFEMFYLVARLSLQYLFGDYDSACETASRAARIIRDYAGTIWDEQRVQYHALALCARASAGGIEAEALQPELDRLLPRLRSWAENAPANFAAAYHLVLAEAARARNDFSAAIANYEQALIAARTHGSVRDEALATERYALFWLAREHEVVAAGLIEQARRLYVDWGATAKADALSRESEHLVVRSGVAVTRAAPAGPTADATLENLDAFTVIKASHALASEIDREKLLGKLVSLVIANAGAQRGLLIQESGGQMRVVAEARLADPGESVALEETSLETYDDLLHAVVRLTHRTGTKQSIDDAVHDPAWREDPYVVRRQPRSILCLPIVHQGRRRGILYLENNLAPNAFPAHRIEMLRVLSVQAAIALENSQLYGEMKQEVERRRMAEDALLRAMSELETLKNRLEAENVYLQEEIRTQHGFEDIIGESPALLRVLHQVEQVAPSDANVLITGETGTGKELIARAIHGRSRRRDRSLVSVNCGAIASGLVESELFGHEKGAFTGAIGKKIGRFELADGGTIFLDEVGDLPADAQVKLLRVLQNGEFERVGGNRTIHVDVRVVAATHQDLDEAVHGGRFRSDLFYRLNVFPIRTPTLAERKDDIPALVRSFLHKLNMKFGRRIESIPRATLDALMAYSWPGNVRELRNIVERCFIVSSGSSLELGEWLVVPDRTALANPPATLEEAQREHIVDALERTAWRVSGERGAARLLGIKPTTLEARMKKLGIVRPSRTLPQRPPTDPTLH